MPFKLCGGKYESAFNMNKYVKEYRWPLVVSLLILTLSTIPIIAGYAAQTSDQRFIGIFYDRQDYAVHRAMMLYGEQGNWDYQFRFTTEAHTGAYLRIFYVVLGHLTGWTGLPFDIIFQAARLAFGLLACLAIYRLMTRVFPVVNQRRLAFVLAILGAGLGWFQAPLGLVPDPKISPIDLWLIDAYIFFSIALFPHFAAVIASLALALTAFWDHLQRPGWRNIIVIAMCALFVQIVNPIAFVLADCAMMGAFVFSCWQKRRFNWTSALTLGLLAVIQVPLLVYSWNLLTYDPAWAEYNLQNATLSPPPIYYLLGFGLFWPFVAIGTIKAFRKPDAGFGLALSWSIAALALAYLPIAIQRRFLLGVTIPLAVLATPAILEFSDWLHRHLSFSKLTGAIVIAALTIISPLVMVSAYSVDMFHRPASLFEPAALVQATDWLNENGAPDQVVLAAEPTAQLIAIRTHLKLYFGHVMETLHYAEKAQAVERFYRGEQPAAWLQAQGITWVIFGPHEKPWGQFPPGLPNLKVAYQNDDVTIYKVVSP
ncbi:MAG: hypothetical protein WA821_23445 [Anaerolineales bacterium]